MKLCLTEEQLRRMEEMIYDRVLREAWWETQLLGTMVDSLHPGDPLVKAIVDLHKDYYAGEGQSDFEDFSGLLERRAELVTRARGGYAKRPGYGL